MILKLTDKDFMRLVDYMKTNYGINLIKKRILIEGRLTNHVQELGFTDYASYLDRTLSGKDSIELATLINKLTTNHTFFLREIEHFEFLKSTILPHIEKTVKDKDARIWCAASSTGQEPYTLAMIIDEYFGAEKKNWDCKILATDISTDVLKKAKEGIYTDDMIKDVPKDWLAKYFTKLDAKTYQIIPRIRQEVVFRQFNLMDPIQFKKPYDLISCRNVMIYFEADTKNALIERFYDVVKPGGYLFIGHAENVSKDTQFDFVRPAIYRKSL